MWIAKARGMALFLCFAWTFIAVMDLTVGRDFAWVSVTICAIVWGLTWLQTRVDNAKTPSSDV